MIDEKKLIEESPEWLNPNCGGKEEYNKGWNDCNKYWCNTIERQPKVGEWIPCSERLPDDRDNRFYMCTVENHEEDQPMFCQYEEEYGFGFWNDIYDEHTLGFVDSEFKTNEELGYEKVIAWQPLPEPYRTEKESEQIE